MNHSEKKCNWKKELNKVSWLAWIIKIIPIPVEIAASILIGDIILEAVDGKAQEVFLIGINLIGMILFTRLLIGILDIYYRNKSSQVLHHCKIRLYESFLNSPPAMLYISQNGEAKEKLNDDFETVTDKDLKFYPEFWTAVIMAVMYFCYLFFQNPLLAVVLCMISLIQAVPPLIVKKYMQKNYEKNRDIEAEITDFILEGIDGFITIKLYHLKNWWMTQIKRLYKEYKKIGNLSIYTSEMEIAMNSFVSGILKYGTYGIVGLFVLYQYSSLETGIRAIALSGNLFFAVRKIFSSIPQFAVVKTAEKRLSVWYQSYPQRESMIQNSEIEFCNVSFSYEKKEILQNFSVIWKPGEKTVVKGKNGAGKSTLLKIIISLQPFQKGKVSIGGLSVENLGMKNFPNQIYYLPQEDILFSVTPKELYDMILSERVKSAVEMAEKFGLTEDVIKNKKINELSGGECKKVYLALGFAIHPKILLLDEPTNSLDTEGKRVLYCLLKDYIGGVVIVTHETIFDTIADNICYI